MILPSMLPAAFDPAKFLRESWQKTPCLIRNPWTDWTNPLDPDELAGLACEDEVESRLVTRSSETWELEHGPLPEQRFGELGKQPWTLLVQAVDHHIPAVAQLLHAFRFIPNWRVDDVMVSYAVDGGGVGPHFDQYDVFLIQGLGRRRWQLGGPCDQATELSAREDARLLAHFEAVEEWVLDPGDILYLPPRIAHHGVAMGDDCMTYSIGFRAPSRAELIAAWAQGALEQGDDDDRYADPDLQVPANPGEISPEAIARAHAMIAEALLDREAFARWFAGHGTAPKNPDIDWRPDEPIGPQELRRELAAGAALVRNPASRFAFLREDAGALSLFVDGRCFACRGDAAALAERLCAGESELVDPSTKLAAPVRELLLELLNQGSLGFDRSV